MALEFRILGPLEVLVDERALVIGGKRQRAVLAALLLEARRVVPTDQLVSDLWGESPPKTATTSLQNLVSQLRKQLGAETLVTQSPGYVLQVQRGPDRRASLRADAEERTARRAGGAPGAAAARPRTLARPAAGGVRVRRLRAGGDQASRGAPRSSRSRSGSTRTSSSAGTATSSASSRRLVAQHPLRETFRRQLMLALYRSGRQAEALDVYQDARTRFVEELGIEPGPELGRLQAEILRHEAGLATPDATQAAEDEEGEIVKALVGRER